MTCCCMSCQRPADEGLAERFAEDGLLPRLGDKLCTLCAHAHEPGRSETATPVRACSTGILAGTQAFHFNAASRLPHFTG